MRSVVGRGVMRHNRRMPSTFARQLRADATEAEIRLWSKLRRKQLEGFRFRRQQPMGNYIVDFFCPDAALVVEVDGGQHVDEDPTRERWLESRGYRVLRFWNNEVLANTEGVLETILDALRNPPKHQPPPPLRGRVGVGGGDLRDQASAVHAKKTSPPSLPSPSRGEGVWLRGSAKSEAARAARQSEKKSSPPLRGRVREGGGARDQLSEVHAKEISPPSPPSPSRGEGR